MNGNVDTLSHFMLGEPCSHLGPTINCIVSFSHAVHLSQRWLGTTLPTLSLFPHCHLTTRPHVAK